VSRLYRGSYSVLLKLEDGTYAFTEPAAYEDCEKACILFGWGMAFERKRVVRARIQATVNGETPEPGLDFEIERLT
jgi:hypothetical protein